MINDIDNYFRSNSNGFSVNVVIIHYSIFHDSFFFCVQRSLAFEMDERLHQFSLQDINYRLIGIFLLFCSRCTFSLCLIYLYKIK